MFYTLGWRHYADDKKFYTRLHYWLGPIQCYYASSYNNVAILFFQDLGRIFTWENINQSNKL